jgi:Glycoside hydrolase 123, N-terminal domain
MNIKRGMEMIFLAVLFISVFSLNTNAVEYREVPLQDKTNDRDLTFCVTFDKYDVNANLAKGNPVSTTLKNLNLGLRGTIGFDTRQAFKPVGNEELKFQINKNVNLREGTITLWLCGKNYAPGAPLTDGKKRGNIALLEMQFENAKNWVNFKLYEYGGTAYFDWRNSLQPLGWGSVGRASAPLTGIKKDQWFQLALTWTPTHIAIFVNGKLISNNLLPLKAAKSLDLKPDSAKSFLGLRSAFYEDKKIWENAIDDIKIYSRALKPLKIKNNYLKLLKSDTPTKIENYSMELNGLDDGSGKLDRLEAVLDFSTLNDVQKKQFKTGKTTLEYCLTGPDKFNRQGTWKTNSTSITKTISGIKHPGLYKLVTTLKFPNGKAEKISKTITCPDLSYAGNGIGTEDIVPKPWTPLLVSKDRTVKMWNRVYKFGSGPFPETILVKGKSLLNAPPTLNVKTINGKADLTYTATGMKRGKSWLEFTGTGKAKDFSLNYTTRVEFDGFIKTDFVINGCPEIISMEIKWTVNPVFSKYLMAPLLQNNRSGNYAFPFPIKSWNTNTQLWLVSEQGGFCWSTSNDANWIYNPEQKVLKANQKTGQCEVDMITHKTKLPAGASYQALFIATPTRPLPAKNRLIRLHGKRPNSPKLLCCAGEGLEGAATFRAGKGFANYTRHRAPGSVAVYGMADALTTVSPIALYFRKYWYIPGAHVYNCNYKKIMSDGKVKKIKCFTASACNSTSFPDYILNNINELFKNKYGDRVGMIYYDLCGNRLCASKLHGCSFKDKFGRQINTFAILSKRKLIKRTVRLCHKNNRTVITHAQRSFFPMFTGLSDYWFPGEQHGGMLRRNPYGYTDEVPDILYRTEYNRKILGTGVIFLPSLGYAKMSYFKKPKYTEAMLCMLLANDIESAKAWAVGAVMYKVWNALEKYDFASPEIKCHLYYEQSKIKSSDSNVRVTWYECPNKQYLFILTNKDLRPHTSNIDISAIKKGNYTVREEYTDKDIVVKNGVFSIEVPARSFRIVAFPPKGIKYNSDFSTKKWGSWKQKTAKGKFLHNKTDGHKAKGCLEIVTVKANPKKSGFCFLERFPVKPGKNYNAIVWIKVLKANADANFYLSFQGQDEKKHFLGLPPKSIKLKGDKTTKDWQRLVLTFTIPETGKWAKVNYLLCTIGMNNTDDGRVLFDDFSFESE